MGAASAVEAQAVDKHSTIQLTIKFREFIFNYMVEHDSPQLDLIFRALGDSTRRGMLARLALGEKTVGELAEPFAMSFAGASKHVKVLEEAGLIRREVRGRTHVCTLEPGPLASADQWLRHYDRFWTGRLDALEQLLREDDARKAAAGKKKTPKGDAK